jgi:siderophore synthetase component
VNCAPRLHLHPWQFERLRGQFGWLEPEPDPTPAHPLMSLRTLALAADPGQHVKTAIDVQMTSAVRIVSPAAVHNGPRISALLRSLAPRTPNLIACLEPASGAVLVDGEPSRSLAVVHRRLPILAPGELALPLAVLTAPSPADGRPMMRELIDDPLAFIGALAELLLPPLLTLLELGLALEAHGQNLLVVVRGGRPVRLLYRDLGGIRVSPAQLARHGIEVPPLAGDLASDDPYVLRTKLFAAIGTVLAELVTVLEREYGVDAALGWAKVAQVARARPGPDAAALLGATLPVKAMTAMRLADDPLEDVWADVANPMAEFA